MHPPGDLPNPVIKPSSLAPWADSLPAEPRGKPKNTGVGSLSLLQWIFPTQESNPGLLHCRRILYQLSYQGNRSDKLLFDQDHITSKLASRRAILLIQICLYYAPLHSLPYLGGFTIINNTSTSIFHLKSLFACAILRMDSYSRI